MTQSHTFESAYSLDSDLIIKDLRDHTHCFVYRRRLPYWRGHWRHPQNQTVFQSVIGEAIAETAFVPGTVFWRMRSPDRPPSATERDLCLLFRLANGLTLAYTSSDEVVYRDSTWFGARMVSVAASPNRHATCSDFAPTSRPVTPPARFRDEWFQLRILEEVLSHKPQEEFA